jgi:uncharacterized protein YkwD
VEIGTLRENSQLLKSSRFRTDEIVSTGYFNHTSPDGTPFYSDIQKANYYYRKAGEVLARGCETEKCVLDIWIASPAHRQIMTGRGFRDIGCSAEPAGPEDRFVVVCHFGEPLLSH